MHVGVSVSFVVFLCVIKHMFYSFKLTLLSNWPWEHLELAGLLSILNSVPPIHAIRGTK